MLIVLGMHRSGTSAMAGVLSKLGFNPGKTLLSGNQFNERGYFEDECIVNAHDRLLAELDRSWLDIRSLPVSWTRSTAYEIAKRELISILHDEYDDERYILLKDPRMCLLLPLWLDIAGTLGLSPSFILTVRSPIEVSQSLRRVHGLSESHSAMLYCSYLLAAENATRGKNRLIIDYSSLLNNWRALLTPISSLFNVQAMDVNHSFNNEIASFLSPSLRNYISESDQSVRDIDVSMQRALRVYLLLKDGLDSSTESILDDILKEYECTIATFLPWLDELSEVKRLNNYILRPPLPPDSSNFLLPYKSSLYWKAGADYTYSELNKVSIGASLTHIDDIKVICFEIPDNVSSIKELRLTIADCCAYVEVYRIWIEDDAGREIWISDKESPLFLSPSDHFLYEHLPPSIKPRSHIPVVSVGIDPYATINLPSEPHVEIAGGCKLFIELASIPLAYGLGRFLNSCGKYPSTHEAKPLPSAGIPPVRPAITPESLHLASSLESLAGLLKSSLARRDQTIAQQVAQINRMREELIRAEAQLDLLKDVMLGGREEDRL